MNSLNELAFQANQAYYETFPKLDLTDFSQDLFYRTFGKSNPDIYSNPFYSYMIKHRLSPYSFKSSHNLDYEKIRPIFTMGRIGMSKTEIKSKDLTVYIGGEYDDFYDPDFLIYNDVICEWKDGAVKHFGYPESVFPCTDFHSATYYPLHNAIYIIGRVGYDSPQKKEFKATEVFALDLESFAISKVEVMGVSPGWISSHKAKRVGEKIMVSFQTSEEDELQGETPKKVWLNLNNFVWEWDN